MKVAVMTDVERAPTDAEIDKAIARGDELFDEFLDNLADETADPLGVAYSLWSGLTLMLLDGGWTAEDLSKDICQRAATQDTEGSA